MLHMVYASQGQRRELLYVGGCDKVFIPKLQLPLCIQGGEFQLEFSEAARRLWLQLNQACTSLFGSCPPFLLMIADLIQSFSHHAPFSKARCSRQKVH